MSKRLIALIFGALAVGLIAGCGSGSGDSSTSSLTKAQFTKQGEAICTKYHDKIIADFGTFAEKHKNALESADAVTEFTQSSIVPSFKSEAKEIRDLGAPGGEEDEVTAILVTFEKGIEETEQAGPQSPSAPGIKKANSMAKKFGLKTCMTS